MKRNTNEKLRRFATVLADSNDAVTVVELDGKISAWNRGAEKMYGYSESEALNMDVIRLIPEEKKEESCTLFQQLKSGETIESLETQRITKDGSLLDVCLTITKLTDDDGTIASIATTERDITQRKKTESELKQTIDELQKALEEINTLRGFLPICAACKKFVMTMVTGKRLKRISANISKHSLLIVFVLIAVRQFIRIYLNRKGVKRFYWKEEMECAGIRSPP